MSLSKEELRKGVGSELCEALRFTGRAANLLRHASRKSMSAKAEKAIETADALARIVASTTDYINNLLSR